MKRRNFIGNLTAGVAFLFTPSGVFVGNEQIKEAEGTFTIKHPRFKLNGCGSVKVLITEEHIPLVDEWGYVIGPPSVRRSADVYINDALIINEKKAGDLMDVMNSRELITLEAACGNERYEIDGYITSMSTGFNSNDGLSFDYQMTGIMAKRNGKPMN